MTRIGHGPQGRGYKIGSLKSHGVRRYLPHVFTEHGFGTRIAH